MRLSPRPLWQLLECSHAPPMLFRGFDSQIQEEGNMASSGFRATTQTRCFKYKPLTQGFSGFSEFKCAFSTIKGTSSSTIKCLIPNLIRASFISVSVARTLGLWNFSISRLSHWEMHSGKVWPLSSYSGVPVRCQKGQLSYGAAWWNPEDGGGGFPMAVLRAVSMASDSCSMLS